jgi:hypothetical protein
MEKMEVFESAFRYVVEVLSGFVQAVLWIRFRIHRIHMFLGLPDPDPLVRGMDPDPDPSINMQK